MIALLPQNILPSSNKLKFNSFQSQQELNSASIGGRSYEIMGLADSDDSFEQVQLDGDMNTHEFWEQPEVLDALRKILANDLATASSGPSSPIDAKSPSLENQSSLPPRPSDSTRSFSLFGKKSTPKPQAPPPPAPEIEVYVGLEEVCYRTTSSFGLYETISRPAVFVRIKTR
jgi:hypothetical protein